MLTARASPRTRAPAGITQMLLVGRIDRHADEAVHGPVEGAVEPIGQHGVDDRAFEQAVARSWVGG